MNHQRNRFVSALAGGWQAIVRAFTSTRPDGPPNPDGSDTTLFGTGPEQPDRPSRKTDFWGAGDSSYFADDNRPQKDR